MIILCIFPSTKSSNSSSVTSPTRKQISLLNIWKTNVSWTMINYTHWPQTYLTMYQLVPRWKTNCSIQSQHCEHAYPGICDIWSFQETEFSEQSVNSSISSTFGCFHGVKAAEMFFDSVNFNTCLPFVTTFVPANSNYSGCVIGFLLRVHIVLWISCPSEIWNIVVRFVVIDMINTIFVCVLGNKCFCHQTMDTKVLFVSSPSEWPPLFASHIICTNQWDTMYDK